MLVGESEFPTPPADAGLGADLATAADLQVVLPARILAVDGVRAVGLKSESEFLAPPAYCGLCGDLAAIADFQVVPFARILGVNRALRLLVIA